LRHADLDAWRKKADRGSLRAIHLALGDSERALAALERADRAGISFSPYLWPEWSALFPYPRFDHILRRFGLPTPQEAGR